jgi:hypothetical protein
MSAVPEGVPEPAPPAPRRRWRWWAARAGALLVAGLLGWFGWLVIDRETTHSEGMRELAAARAAVEADDPDWIWDRLTATRAQPPRGKNGAPLIPLIKERTHAAWGKALSNSEAELQLDIPPNVRYSAEVMELVRRELAASDEAVRLARALRDRPFGHREIELSRDVISTSLKDTQDTRQAADLLKWEVVVATADGDPRRTADGLLALLNASRSLGDEPFLVSQLIRMAARAIALRSVERAIAQRADLPLSDMHAALLADADEPLLRYGLRGERGMCDRMLENQQTGANDVSGLIGKSGSPPGFWGNLDRQRYRAHISAERADLLRWMTQWVDLTRRPVHEQPALAAAIPDLPDDGRHVLSRLLCPAVDKVATAYWRSVAEARCAAAGVACERFRQKHDRWPNALTELVPEFLPAVPLDPYSGKPPRYAKLDDGVAVFSAGKHSLSEYAQHRLPAGVDYGFRLYDPQHRGKPAPLPLAPPPRLPGEELPDDPTEHPPFNKD